MDEKKAMITGKIIENRRVAPGHFHMTVQLPNSFPAPSPGQFVMVRTAEQEEPFLARPFSVYGFQRQGEQNAIDLLYRINGRGTSLFSRMSPGAKLSVLGPLGRSFLLPEGMKKVILVAGGVGVAPLVFLLCTGLLPPDARRSRELTFYLGARTEELLTGLERVNGLCDLKICTDDGSREHCGPVTDLLRRDIGEYNPEETVIYACGPTAMIRAMGRLLHGSQIRCQVSLEERMACGLGACLGCAVAVRNETGERDYRRVCRDGPVFDLREIIFDSPAGMKWAGENG
jgi:dihydroorotate dehydrogenase electron transfer subunit